MYTYIYLYVLTYVCMYTYKYIYTNILVCRRVSGSWGSGRAFQARAAAPALRVSDFGFRFSGSEFRVWGFGIWVTGFGCRVHNFYRAWMGLELVLSFQFSDVYQGVGGDDESVRSVPRPLHERMGFRSQGQGSGILEGVAVQGLGFRVLGFRF